MKMQSIPIDAIPGQGETITALNAAGLSAAVIGKLVGRSAWGVCLWLKRRGIWAPQRRALTQTDKARIDHLYFEEGLTLLAIAEEMGRDDATIRSYLYRSGQHVPAYSWRSAVERERMGELYDRRVPVDVILRQFNISRQSFYDCLRSTGRTPRRHREITQDEQERIVELYASEMPIDHIARQTRRPRSTVLDVLRRAGVHDPVRSAATLPSRPKEHMWSKTVVSPKRARRD